MRLPRTEYYININERSVGCCDARPSIAAVYEMLLLSSVTLPLNSCPAHVDSGNNY